MIVLSGTRRHLMFGTTLLLGAVLAATATSQEKPPADRLGKVEFKVTCSAGVQQSFNRAMALYHSFAWVPAADLFVNIAKTDATCGMAHWGRAMVLLDNPFAWPGSLSPALLDNVEQAIETARSAGLNSTREKDYVEALSVFLRDRDKTEHRVRLKAFDQAMSALMQRYPDDKEAAILSALVTSANFDPTDKTYANQLNAAKILEPIFAAQPDHPGVAHYLIHSYDYPPIAKHGLAAARRYAQIAPDAPHALHMPSHIFTRIGHWQESIDANRASAKTALRAQFDGHHAFDYMVYAHLQLAQDKAAREAMNDSFTRQTVDHFAAAYAYAAMPARLALEVGDWQAAAKVELKPKAGEYSWQKYPQAEAINAFARGVGAARAGDSAAAGQERDRLTALRDLAKERKLGYWAEQIDIQAEVVRGLMLVADGKADDGLGVLAAAAKREDATEKHVVTPGPLLPAREVLADVLLETGKAAEAQREYEAVLAKEPNRYRATFGAGEAAQKAGNRDQAKQHFAALLELGKAGDTQRKSLAEARDYQTSK